MDANNEVTYEKIELDLKAIFYVLLARAKMILAITVIMALIAAFVSIFLIPKSYKASVRFYVSNNKDVISQNIDAGDIDASTKLVPTYAELLISKAVIAGVIEDAKLDCSIEQLLSMLSVAMVPDTQMLILNVVSNNPDDAFLIANAIADNAPERITEIMNGSIIKAVDYADKPMVPSSPNVVKNILFGAFLGIVLSVVMIILFEINDSTIKSEEDIRGIFSDIPIIGIIPNIPAESDDMVRGK